MALGLLSEDEAVQLLLGTTEVNKPTTEQIAASKKISKIAGYLPLCKCAVLLQDSILIARAFSFSHNTRGCGAHQTLSSHHVAP